MFIDPAVGGMISPALISGSVAMACNLPLRAVPSAVRGAGGAIGIALAYLVGHTLLSGWTWLPSEPWQWLPLIGVLIAMFSLIEVLARPAITWRRVIGATLAGAAVLLLLRPVPMSGWTLAGGTAAFIALWLFVLAIDASLDALAKRIPGGTLPLLLATCAMCGGVVLFASGNARLAQLTSVLAAALGGAMVAGWYAPQLTLAGGASRVVTLLLSGLLICGYFGAYTKPPIVCFLLIGFAPSGAWMAELPSVQRLNRSQVFAVRCVGALTPALTGAAWAWRFQSGLGEGP